MPPYGPVPVSRMKAESSAIFTALSQGRRVLISRRGQVVATIEPADRGAHGDLLESFALGVDVPAVSSTDLSQSYIGSFVDRARAGANVLLTKRNVVKVVVTGPPATASAESVDAEEELLAAFERDHPDASPAEFAAFAASLDPGVGASSPLQDDARAEMASWARGQSVLEGVPGQLNAVPYGVGGLGSSVLGTAGIGAAGVQHTGIAHRGAGAVSALSSPALSRLNAYVAIAKAYEAQGDASAAAQAYRQAVAELESLSVPRGEELLIKCELAILAADSDPGAAIATAHEVLDGSTPAA